MVLPTRATQGLPRQSRLHMSSSISNPNRHSLATFTLTSSHHNAPTLLRRSAAAKPTPQSLDQIPKTTPNTTRPNPSPNTIPHPTPRIKTPSFPPPLHNSSPQRSRVTYIRLPTPPRNHSHCPSLWLRGRFPLLRLVTTLHRRRRDRKSRRGEIREVLEEERMDLG
jgi:hypothetical protein